MTVPQQSGRNTVPLGVALLAAIALATGWLLFLGASFVLGCIIMLALTGGEVALLVRNPRDH